MNDNKQPRPMGKTEAKRLNEEIMAEHIKTQLRFKDGDKAVVMARKHGHNFAIGTVVTIECAKYSGYGASADGSYWYLEDEELEPLDERFDRGNKTAKHSVGDTVVIAANSSGIRPGTECTVTSIGPTSYRVDRVGGKGFWYVNDDEVEAVKPGDLPDVCTSCGGPVFGGVCEECEE